MRMNIRCHHVLTTTWLAGSSSHDSQLSCRGNTRRQGQVPGGAIALGTVLAVYRGGGDRNACRNLAIAALPGLTVALEIL